MILSVGLTGGIASGKSTIARILAGLGCITVDADEIVAQLYRPGAAGHSALLETYGPNILRPDGAVDRVKLASIAFSAPAEAQKLNALIHPLVVAEEKKMMCEEELRSVGRQTIIVVEATLLLEAGGRDRYERIVVVDVEPEVQMARAVARGMSREEAERRIAHQMKREDRLRHADYVIDNSGDETHALAECRRVYAALRTDLERKVDTSRRTTAPE